VHPFSSQFGTDLAPIFEHLDPLTNDQWGRICAKATLFQIGKKIKGHPYQKHFRLDGRFEEPVAFEISKAFFPIEELTEEYFLGS